MKNKIKKTLISNIRPIFLILFIFTSLFYPNFATLEDLPVNKNLYPCNGPDCNFNHIIQLAGGLAKEIFKYAMILAPAVFVYIGWLYASSQDDPAKRSKAKQIAWNVVKGIALMMCAWAIVSLFIRAIVKDSIVDDPSFPIAKPK